MSKVVASRRHFKRRAWGWQVCRCVSAPSRRSTPATPIFSWQVLGTPRAVQTVIMPAEISPRKITIVSDIESSRKRDVRARSLIDDRMCREKLCKWPAAARPPCCRTPDVRSGRAFSAAKDATMTLRWRWPRCVIVACNFQCLCPDPVIIGT